VERDSIDVEEVSMKSKHGSISAQSLKAAFGLFVGLVAVAARGALPVLGALTEYSIPTPDSEPGQIALGSDGNRWFTEAVSARVGRITTAGSITEYPLPSVHGEPRSIVPGPDGNIWFTDADFDTGTVSLIGRISTSGAVTEFPLSNPLSAPCGIAADSDGNLWFTECNINSNAIGRITPAAKSRSS
jgi:streptogramin lyase